MALRPSHLPPEEVARALRMEHEHLPSIITDPKWGLRIKAWYHKQDPAMKSEFVKAVRMANSILLG